MIRTLTLALAVALGACDGGDPKTGDTDSDTEVDTDDTDVVGDTEVDTCSTDDLDELYTRYVEPFVSGQVTSSCSQCHMTGVDMSLYAQDTPCDTMACMVELGVVDLDDPAASDLLSQILMGDPNSSVFDVQAEHDAFLEWITWSSVCNDEICGAIDSPCEAGTGAASTGVDPTGDCSEDDLLAVFWDSVIVDRGRCTTCHSAWAADAGTYGPCDTIDDCELQQECLEGLCRTPGPYYAPHFFEGGEEPLQWADDDDRQLGLNTMYNTLALGMVDADQPLDSTLLTKPLLEGFHPTAIYGDGVDMDVVADGVGTGVYHGGTSKFNFGCDEPPCPTSGVVDCRTDTPCHGPGECPDTMVCSQDYCRLPDSVCDLTYVNYVRFAEYYGECADAG